MTDETTEITPEATDVAATTVPPIISDTAPVAEKDFAISGEPQVDQEPGISTVDRIMELGIDEIRKQLADREVTVSEGVTDKLELAQLLATAAGYSGMALEWTKEDPEGIPDSTITGAAADHSTDPASDPQPTNADGSLIPTPTDTGTNEDVLSDEGITTKIEEIATDAETVVEEALEFVEQVIGKHLVSVATTPEGVIIRPLSFFGEDILGATLEEASAKLPQ